MWLDSLVEEHRAIRRALNSLLLSASSTYMLGVKTPIEHVLPLYKEFKSIFIDSCHHRKEEALASLLASYGYRFSKDLVQLHIIVRDKFKDLMAAYVSGDRGEKLASRVAIYYEAMEEHIEDEEKTIFTEILSTVSKAGLGNQTIEQVFEEIEEGLGKDVHEKMLELVSEIENRLSNIISESGAAAINVIPVKPYERHALIKKIIQEIKGKGVYKLILVNDHEPIPLYYELIHTEACFNQDLFRSKQLSSRVWASQIALRERCK